MHNRKNRLFTYNPPGMSEPQNPQAHEGTRITLFGMGVWGSKIARKLLEMGVDLTVVDVNPGVMQTAESLGANAFHETFHVPGDTQGVVVATPSTTHFDLLRRLAPLGVPTFVEKPLTTDAEQARSLRELEGATIFVMHTWLYHPGIAEMASIASEGVLGKLKHLRTNRTSWTSPRKDADTVWNLLPHDLTIVRAILGYYPEPRYAAAELHEGIARGMTCLLGVCPFTTIEISNRYRDRRREVRMHFDQGVVVLPDEKTTHLELYIGDHRSETEAAVLERRPFSLDPDPLSCELACFLDYLHGGPEPQSSLEEGIEVVLKIDEIRQLANLTQ